MWLFLAFLLVPLIEIALFIQVGGAIGLLPTLLIVILTAVVGTTLVRAQGIAVWGQLRASLDRFEDPAQPLVHGAMILFAGALLLTPGFFTDAVGLGLLVPGVRVWLFERLQSRIAVQARMGGAHTAGGPSRADPRRAGRPDIIDGDFEEVDPRARPGNSGWTQPRDPRG
jgi:UPF0716 protein FxsA